MDMLSNFYINPYAIPHFISGHLFVLFGIFVFLQNRRSLNNFSYLLVCISCALWLYGDVMIMCSANKVAADLVVKFVYIGVSFIPPSCYFFSVAWLDLWKTKKKWVIANYLIGLVFIVLFYTTDKFVIGYQKHFFGYLSRLSALALIYVAFFGLVVAAFIQNLIGAYRRETIASKRIQIRRVLIAFIIGFSLGSTEYLITYGMSIYPFGSIASFWVIVVVAQTIIQHRLMEIETVIHRTIAWFFTSAALAAPLAVLFYFTRAWHNKLTPVGAWSYFGAAFLFFLFFVKAFQPKVDNFFRKGKVYLEGVLSKFADELVHLHSVEELVNKISDTITNTLHTNKVTVFLYNGKLRKLTIAGRPDKSQFRGIQLNPEEVFLKWLSQNDRVLDRKFIEIDPSYESIRVQAKEYFQKLGTVICIPLILNRRLIGIINLSQKANLQPFKAADLYFLTRIKSASTIAISNSLVYDNIEEQVRQRTRELIETQQQLVQAEKLATIGTLAGGVAHEINNPLAAVMTNAQMLKDSQLNEEDKESVDLIEEAAKRCRAIIQKLMLYSRKPMGKREVDKVDLEIVLKNVIAFLGYQLKQENVRISLKKDNPPFIIAGNQNELEQVLTNLIINARDATKAVRKHGELQVALSKTNSHITVKVTDEGKGIAKEDLKRIFDPFFTTKEVGKGTGLGLSICHSIIEQHHGNIRAESDGKNGAAFIVMLPGA